MITVKEARDIVMSQRVDWGIEHVSIMDCVGRFLQEDIVADRDFPPFDRVTMDGIEIKYEDFESGARDFEIKGLQTAGSPQKVLDGEATAHEIMTGAILSDNASAVIRYEDIEICEKGGKQFARVNLDELFKWKNVHRKGSDKGQGTVLIKKGVLLDASHVAILATVGKSLVKVSRFAKSSDRFNRR